MAVFSTALGKLDYSDTAGSLKKMERYLRNLQEELEFRLANLDSENFNETGLKEIGRTITEPLSVEIEDAVKGLDIAVTNGDDYAVVQLKAGDVLIGSSKNIQMDGVVTFTNLSQENSQTVIDGGNIRTGTIRAVDLEGCTFKSLLDTSGGTGGEYKMYYHSMETENMLAGGLKIDDAGSGEESSARYRLFLYTNNVGDILPFALKLQSAGAMSLESGGTLWIQSTGDITITAPNINLNGNVNANGKSLSQAE